MNSDLNSLTAQAAYALLRTLSAVGGAPLPALIGPPMTASLERLTRTAFDLLLSDPGVIDHAPCQIAERLYDVLERLPRAHGASPLCLQNATTRRLYHAVSVAALAVTDEYLATIFGSAGACA